MLRDEAIGWEISQIGTILNILFCCFMSTKQISQKHYRLFQVLLYKSSFVYHPAVKKSTEENVEDTTTSNLTD